MNSIMIRNVIVLLCIVAITNALPSCTPQFTCVNTTTYQLHGHNQTCAVGYVCNEDYTDVCEPCVQLNEETCQFKCNGNVAELTINAAARATVLIPCAAGKVCNAYYLDTCAPCIDQVCPETYTCNPAKASEVSVSGLTFNCLEGKICNSHYKYPCDLCITKPPVNPPVTYPPNCNDGYGLSNPCRPGPLGSNFYYKCQKISKHYFDYEIKKCLWQCLDSACYKNKNICR